MIALNYLAIVAAAIATFVFAGVYYSALAGRGRELGAEWAGRARPPVWLMGLELAKSLVVAATVAALVALIGITSLGNALLLVLALWIAFPIVLLVGSVTQENVPSGLAAIHAGDWLAKLVIIGVIVTVWR